MAYLDHLDLVELVQANEPARIATSAARLFAEARREGAVFERQLIGAQDLIGVDVRELHFSGGDKIETFCGLEQVFLELRKLTGTRERLGVRHDRTPPFLVATRDVRIGHEADERALETSTKPAQQHEARFSRASPRARNR